VQTSGTVGCQFDNTATAGDYVQQSTTTAGNCHDTGVSAVNTGSAYPTNGLQVVGTASANGPGVQNVFLWGGAASDPAGGTYSATANYLPGSVVNSSGITYLAIA